MSEDFQFKAERKRIDTLPLSLVLEELQAAARHFAGRQFSRREFDRVAKRCKGTTVLKHFETWSVALNAIGTPLQPYRPDRKQISDEDLLAELARVWRYFGHRPSKNEWEATDTLYSYTTYKQRFGGWTTACASLVDRAAQGMVLEAVSNSSADVPESPKSIPTDRKRDVPLKLRLKILTRDGFKCVLCGRTPALYPGAVLHLDHIEPFSNDGPTSESNLRTLCEQCNWGKGNDTVTHST